MSLFDESLFGSQSKEERNRRNRQKGQIAEQQVEMELQMEGFEVERVHEGADFRAIRRDFMTGEIVEEKLVEVKSGNSGLTERQKERKRRSDNYEVRRRDPFVL